MGRVAREAYSAETTSTIPDIFSEILNLSVHTPKLFPFRVVLFSGGIEVLKKELKLKSYVFPQI